MALTPSTMKMELGSEAPSFTLPDTTGKQISLEDFQGVSGYLIIFMCNHCPYVVHVRDALAILAKEYQSKGVAVIGINANDPQRYPDDSPAKMVEEKKKAGYTFPYLFDETQEVAHAYHAACTPDFFVYDADRKLYYRGQFDDTRPNGSKPATGSDLRAALDAMLARKSAPKTQKPSTGCSIKWKPGNEPSY